MINVFEIKLKLLAFNSSCIAADEKFHASSRQIAPPLSESRRKLAPNKNLHSRPLPAKLPFARCSVLNNLTN